jgi:UDP-3-O-[3-hydroxymyristoyl] glucosamine N-acyltransferase
VRELYCYSCFKRTFPENQNFIVVDNPYLAFAILPMYLIKRHSTGIESTAQIHPSAIISDTAYIGHYVVIGENCVVGDNTVIQSHVN